MKSMTCSDNRKEPAARIPSSLQCCFVGALMIVKSYSIKNQTSHMEKGALRQSSNVNFKKDIPQILLG
jgi:hypothetical protein